MSGKSRGLGIAVLAMIVAFDLAGLQLGNAYVPLSAAFESRRSRDHPEPVTLYLDLTGNHAVRFRESCPLRASKVIWNGIRAIAMAPQSRKERSSSVSSATSIRRNSIKPKGRFAHDQPVLKVHADQFDPRLPNVERQE